MYLQMTIAPSRPIVIKQDVLTIGPRILQFYYQTSSVLTVQVYRTRPLKG